MIYYSIAAITPLFVIALNTYLENSVGYRVSKRNSIIISIFPMILLYALRHYSIGNDTVGYVKSFLEMQNYSFAYCFSNSDRFETGFLLYNKIISCFTDNYTVYFTVTAIILFGALGRFAYKYAGNPHVFLFLFVSLGTYNFYLTGMRQALAIAICLIAFDYIKPKKFIKFVLLVLLAACFHKSALIFLIIYPLCILKNLSLTVTIYVCAAIVLTLSFSSFNNFINQLFGYDYGVEQTGNGEIFLIIVLILTVYSLLNVNTLRKVSFNFVPLMHLSLFTVMLWVLRLISRVAERPSFYFICGLYALTSLTYEYSRWKDSKLVNICIILVSFALFLYRNLGISYKFFWMA